MKKLLLYLFLSLPLIFAANYVQAQSVDQLLQQSKHDKASAGSRASCIGSAVSNGNLTPTTTNQTVNATAGTIPFWSFNATAGINYVFSTCGSGEDTYLEIDQNGVQLYYIDDSGPLCTGSSASMKWQCTASGTYQVTLSHYGCATLNGNISMSYYIVYPPAITALSPAQGVPGDVVTITGNGFTGISNVNFNGTNTFFTVFNQQQIQTNVPSGATTGRVFVTLYDSSAQSTVVAVSPYDFTVLSLGALIYNFTPTQGPAGTLVTVYGKGFTGITGLQLNNMTASYNFLNDSTLTFTVPAGATTGKIKVQIGGSDYLSTADFVVDNCVPPTVTISGFGPYTINATGGNPPYTYSVNGGAYTGNNTFSNTQGNNTILVKDATGCVATFNFTISPAVGCDVLVVSGGQGTTYTTHILGSNAGVVTIDYDFYPIPDQMDVYYNGSVVASTGTLVSGQGTIAFNYPASGPQSCIIKMTAPLSGTAWQYKAGCPKVCDIVVDQRSLGNNTYQFNVTGGVPPYTYAMDGGAPVTSNTFPNLTLGAHTLIITDNLGCTKTHSFDLAAAINCSGTSTSGGQGTSFTEVVFLGYTAGTVNVSYDMYSIPDKLDVLFNGNLVATTGGLVSGASTLSFYYPGNGNSCIVRMYAPESGTAWDYTVSCPVGTSVGNNLSTSEEKILVWPVPSSNMLSFNDEIGSVELMNLNGQIVKHAELKDHQLAVDDLENGIYFAKMKINGQSAIRKISIMK